MPWYAPWSESIKKRACRYLLQRYLGQFLEEKLTLEQLSVDLYRGTGTVTRLQLDTEAINELGESQNWPLQIVDGYMEKISVTIPWSTLLKDDSVVEVHGLSITVQPKMRSEPSSSMLESMWSSMSSSMQLAAECLQAETVPDAQPVEGIEMFAHAIDSILCRVKVKFIDTKIRIEHVPKNSDTGIALEIHIRNIDYLDEAGSEPPPDLIDGEKTKTYVVSTFTSKRIAFEGVTFYTDEYPSKSRTMSRTLVMERSQMSQSVKTKTPDDVNIDSVLADVFYESRNTFEDKSKESSVYLDPTIDSEDNPKVELSHDEDKPSTEQILFGKLTGRQELSLKIKQSDEATGPKVDLQMTLGSLILFLSPRQLHLLLELANGLSSPHLEDTSNLPLRSGGLSECKPMRAADFQRVEAQLLGTIGPGPPQHSHIGARGWSGPSFEDSDGESDKFHPLSSAADAQMTDSCTSSVSSMSTSVTSNVSGFTNNLMTGGGARIKRNRKIPQIDGDPTAEVSHINIRVTSCSCILLHKDILIPTSIGMECVLSSSVKKMHGTACEFFDKLGLFAVSGYGSKDFELANQTFDSATSLSHLRLISTSLTLDGSEKTTSQGCQTTGHLTVTRLHFRECLYSPDLRSYDLIKFDRNDESGEDEAFANPLAGLPDVKIVFKQTQKAMRIAGEKKLVYPTTDVSVTCSPCCIQVDLTLLDRIASTLHGGAPCAPRAMPPPPPHELHAQHHHQRAFKLQCSHLTTTLRFPIIDLRPGAPREIRHVREDYLRLNLNDAILTSTHTPAPRRPAPTALQLQAACVDIYYHENESDAGTHIARSTADDSMDPNILNGSNCRLPTVTLTFLPTKTNKGPFDSSSDEEQPYDSITGANNPMTHSIHLMDKLKENSNPSPFSSKKMVHQSDTAHDKDSRTEVEELVVPGSAKEMADFTQHAVAHSAVHLDCSLPVLSLQLLSKQLYEVLYNRINCDLMLWEPWQPEQYSMTPSCPLQPVFLEPNIYPAFSMCKSALSYDSDTASSSSEDDDFFYSTYESRVKQKRLAAAKVDSEGKSLHDFCLTLKVDKGLLTMYTPIRDGNSRVVPGQAGEVRIVTSKLAMCQVAGVRGKAKHALMCLRSHAATLLHSALIPASTERPPLHVYGSVPGSHLVETIYPSGSGMTSRESSARKDLLSLAIGVEPHKDLPNFKKIRVALGMDCATLRHRGATGTAWLTQLIDQVDVIDYPVPGYRPSTVLTELHVHLWDCAVDYRPLYLPIRAVLTLGTFSISSNVIANTNTSNLRCIAQECALSLMQVPGCRPGERVAQDDDKPVVRQSYVCVMDLALFELSLRMTDKNCTSGPQVDLRASNNVVHVRTCWDSASALSRLLTYVAADGDSQPPTSQQDTPHTSIYSDRADALLVGVEENQPEEIRELSPSEVQQVHDLMAEAMKESPNSTFTDDELNKSSEKEGVEVFFFPDESNSKNPKKPSVSRESSEAPSMQAELDPREEGHFDLEEEPAPIAQVMRDLGDPAAKPEKKPDRQAKTSEGGNTDDEFCVVECAASGEDDELAAPTVRWLTSEPVHMLENHFAIPVAKTDVLKAPKNFPTPVLRYTLCEMSVVWHMYGGNDFTLPSDESANQNKKHVTINESGNKSHQSPTNERRGASYEPYEKTRQTAAAYLQRGVAWGKGEGVIRPGGTPAPRASAGWKQRGGPQRDLHTHVEIQLNKVKFQHETYPGGGTHASRQTLAVGKLEVRDRLAQSHINKFLSHHVSKEEPERRHAHMLVVKAVHLRPEPALPAQECCLKVSLLPLRFHIDQDTLLFLVHFFSKLGSDGDATSTTDEDTRSAGGASTDSGSPKTTPTHRPPVMSLATHLRDPPPPTPAPSPDTLSLNELATSESGEPLLEPYEAERLVSDNLIQLEEEWHVSAGATESRRASAAEPAPTDTDTSPVYFRRVVFAPEVPIRLDYVGKRVDLSAGPVAGLLMGLGQLNCSELRLKRLYHRHGILGVERLARWALQEWLADIKRHQLPGLLSGIGPMHSLVQLLTGIRDLLWLPVEQWRRDGRLVHGLRRGAASFTARTAVAALDITARILHIIQATAETALDMLTPGPTLQLQGAYEQRRRRRRRRNDPSRQPGDIREGVANAVQLVREGFAETAETMTLAARSERGVGVLRHLPGAAVAPLALAAAGAADVLGGVRSQLVPHHRRHHRDKWRIQAEEEPSTQN